MYIDIHFTYKKCPGNRTVDFDSPKVLSNNPDGFI